MFFSKKNIQNIADKYLHMYWNIGKVPKYNITIHISNLCNLYDMSTGDVELSLLWNNTRQEGEKDVLTAYTSSQK